MTTSERHPGLERLEFHRRAVGLAPSPGDRNPGLAVFIPADRNEPEFRSCGCQVSKKKTCPHILELTQVYRAFLKEHQKPPAEAFQASIWYELATILGDASREDAVGVRFQTADFGGRRGLRIWTAQGREAARYYSDGSDAERLADRFRQLPEGAVPNRFHLLDLLKKMTLTDMERTLLKMGQPSFRLLLEGSVWRRLAYHCFLEFGGNGVAVEPGIDGLTGDFTLACSRADGETVIRFITPRPQVKNLLKKLAEKMTNAAGLAIHPIPLKSIFHVSRTTELDLEIRPMIQVMQENGEERLLAREDFERFRYGDLVYLKELGIMAELEKATGPQKRYTAPVRMVLKKSQVPQFLEEHGAELAGDHFRLDESVRGMRIVQDFDRFEISPQAMDRDWCWLDARYGFGSTSVSLGEIIRARAEGRRYIATDAGWVDCQAEAFEGLARLSADRVEASGRVKLSRLDLLQFQAASGKTPTLDGTGEGVEELRRLFDMKPLRDNGAPAGLLSELRHYQLTGLNWLRFLWDNRLGGLLCDEMGLGKTHQAMALMADVMDIMPSGGPFLVVCPTSVLHHWRDKIERHAPGLAAVVHHGPGRDLSVALEQGRTVITSYGIQLQDSEALSEVDWSLAVFDEIQNLKNPQTQTHRAALTIKAGLKLGLSGTPVENRLEDLKALFDLVLPGYLGSDADFRQRYSGGDESSLESSRKRQLARLVAPFTLRRLKQTVLTELPDKIEDIRTCELSEDQVKLYRDAVQSRGNKLLDVLRDGSQPVPYIHIFALLNLLKRICDHPALVEKDPGAVDQFASGKWELFKAILSECLESGEKVVVYSQYLDMIRIIERHLKFLDVGHVVLTGKSLNRGKIVERFDRDPECRAFVGSLKAGGVGIDLIAASVVIHYDRWWNAAREDQATDRVHRIGQRKGVQVFKMVTEGTLEEKIAAIIERKKGLLNSVVKEDDPDVLKTFTPEELAELLTFSR